MDRIEKKGGVKGEAKNNNMFLSLFEHAISGILYGNPDTGQILDANPAAAKMFGYTIEELRKLNRNDIFDFKHHSMVNSLKTRQENGSAKGELIGIRKNGERFPCEFSSSIFKNEIGENRTSTILNDISERKKTEEEMDLLINNTEESFVLVDKQLNIVSFNKQFKVRYETLFNDTISKGDSILNFVQGKKKEIAKEIYKKVFNGEIVDDEVVISEKNKGDALFFIRYKPALDCSGNVIGAFVTSRDITEKRSAQIKLKNNSELFEKLTSKLPAAIYQFEISPDGKMCFPYISKGIEKINPSIDVELIKEDASSAFSTVHPDDLGRLLTSIEISKNNLTDWELEYRSIIDDNTIIWIKGSSSPEMKTDGTVVWYGYFQDITEEKIFNEKIRISKERYDVISKATNDTIWDWDLKTNLIKWNKGIVGVFGYRLNETEMDIEWWFSKIHPEDVIRVRENLNLRISKLESRWEEDYRFICFDGTYKYVHDRGFLVIEEGVPIRMIGAMQDVTEQISNQKKIRRAIERYDFIAKATNDTIWDIDLISNTIEWSNGITTVYGYNKSGSSIYDANWWFTKIHPDDINYIKKKSDNWLESKEIRCEFEYRFICADGAYKFVHDRGFLVIENGVPIRMIGAMQDVTDRKQVEEQLYESEQRFRTIFEAEPECVKLVDVNGNLVEMNNAGLMMLEANSIDEVNSHSLISFVLPKYQPAYQKLHQQVMTGEEGYVEYQAIGLRGTKRWMETNAVPIKDINGVVTMMLSVTRDISNRKKEEHHLKLLESVITNTNDSVMITEAEPFDEPGPKIVYVNEAFTKMTGYTKEEVIGKSPRILQGPKSDKSELIRMKDSMKEWKPCEITIVNYKKNGEEFWINFSIKPIANETGWFTHWIAVERDVTQQKNSELEREQIIAELSQNNKDLKQFSHVTSHNLRAPIANLLGLTSLIEQYKVPNKSLKQILDGVRQSALMFDDTVKDLTKVLVIKDQTHVIKEEVSFVSVIDNVLKQLSISVDDNHVKVNYEFEKAPFVFFTATYLESVLLNLFTNSIKYKSNKRKLKIDISSYTLDNFVVLKFKDNGIGIDIERHKDKIFKLYQRFHDNPDGKGLGLYLVKSQIEALGGTIEVESQVEKGTTFILKFKKEQ